MARPDRVRLEARGTTPPLLVAGTPLLAVGLTLIAGAVLFAALGHNPLTALHAFFLEPLSSAYGLAELLVKAAPLVLCAIGLALGFRGNVWNIGAEGQLVMGAVAGGGVALALWQVEGVWVLPLVLLAGTAGGMAWAVIPAWLRTRFHTSEILVSLMLTYVASLFLSWLVHGPWRNPEGFNFPETRMFSDAALLPILLDDTRLHLGIPFALAAVAAVWFLIARTFIGFQIKVVGLTPVAADHAGFSRAKVVWLSFLVSGGLAGLAGVCEVAGPIGQLQPTVSPGYGFTAIIVAFLGRLHPVGIVLAGLLIALSYLGAETVQITLGLPLAVAGVFQGMLLFFLLACDLLVHYRVVIGKPRVTSA